MQHCFDFISHYFMCQEDCLEHTEFVKSLTYYTLACQAQKK